MVSERSYFIMTFGCQMNEHDSLKIASLMEAEGYCSVEKPERADCIILNTCSVRQKPEQKLYSALGRLRRLKVRRPSLVIGVGGCVAQQEGARLLEKVPHLDFVFGTHHIHQVPEMVKMAREGHGRTCEVSFEQDVKSLHHCPGPRQEGVSSYVTIMQGCNNFCSFCVVPYVRGREQSRSPEEILAEVEDLAARGVREVTLLGQNVNSYGSDKPGFPTFPELLRQIHAVEGVWRIRFTTSHPKDLSPQLMEAVATLSKVCEHMHLPVQSGSSKVLRSMNRGYTREEYLDKIYALRALVPGIALTTDVIVGFPGESEEDLRQTLSLLEAVRFDGIYSFKYSSRPMTSASRFPGHLSEEVKGDRLARVQRLQEEITDSILRGCVGDTEEILVEGPSVRGRGQIMGRTRTNRIVHASGDGDSLRGELLNVRIERSLKHSLWGRIVQGGGMP